MQLSCFGMNSSIRRHGSGLLLLGLLAVPLFGNSALAKSERTPNTAKQDQALVEGRKTWSKDSFSRRRRLLDGNQACVSGAQSSDALKACRKQHKEARRALRKEHHAYMNQVREQAGLPMRDKKSRCRKRRNKTAD